MADESANRFKRLYESAAVAIFELDLAGNLVSANPAMIELFGYSTEEEFVQANRNGALFVNPKDRENWLAKLKKDAIVVNHTKSMRSRDGRRIELQDTTYLVHDESGKPIGYQGTATDVSAIIALTRRLSHDATHDWLTSLPNRRAVEKKLAYLMDPAKNTRRGTHALCYFDLDQFRIVNNTFGHAAGDELLRELGASLKARIGSKDTLARLGGDEFALLLRDRDTKQAIAVANDLLRWIREFRFSWNDHYVDISASIGVVLIHPASGSISDVLGTADTACYTAKEKGRNRVHVQESNDKTVSRRVSEMRSIIELKQALQHDRLTLYQQPIVPLRPDLGREDRFELLVRALDEDGGLLQPGQFLPAAEKYNLSPKIDQWVVESFFKWLSQRPECAASLAYGAINLSGLTLGSDEFLPFLNELFDRYAIEGKNICFEITETAAINDLKSALSFIEELKLKGCRFALDDFGSGVSSFGYLKNLPVDFIKIDGMFVKTLKSDRTNKAIVNSINEVAHSLGLITIAEFVEDDETARILGELGVDFAQGFGLGRPAPLSEFVFGGTEQTPNMPAIGKSAAGR